MCRDLPAEMGVCNEWVCDGKGNLTRPKGVKFKKWLLVLGERAAYVLIPSELPSEGIPDLEVWFMEQLQLRGNIDDVLWRDFRETAYACDGAVRYREWLAGANGAGFELLKSQSITDEQIKAVKRQLHSNRDVVKIQILSCTIHPKCLIYLPPNPQVT